MSAYEDRRNKGLCGRCGAPALPETTINPAASLAMSEGRHVPAAYGRENLLGKPLARIRTIATCADCNTKARARRKQNDYDRRPKCNRCGAPTDRIPGPDGIFLDRRYKTCAMCQLNNRPMKMPRPDRIKCSDCGQRFKIKRKGPMPTRCPTCSHRAAQRAYADKKRNTLPV